MSFVLAVNDEQKKVLISIIIVLVSVIWVCTKYFHRASSNDEKMNKKYSKISGNSPSEKKNGSQVNLKGKSIEKPFESSYYYAHNSSRVTGGYTDGLKISDYEMNGPRLLSKNGIPVENAPKVASSTKVNQVSNGSLLIKKFSWEDSEDNVKIRIENLPIKGSIVETLSWEQADILRDEGSIVAELVNDGCGVILKLKGTNELDYHLRIHNLYGKATGIKIIRKAKRLIVKITKKSNRTWPSLESATPAKIDESEFMADLSSDIKDPTSFVK